MIVIFIFLQIDRSTAIACVGKPLPNLQRKKCVEADGIFQLGYDSESLKRLQRAYDST